jgi:hypothetical protein
VAGFLVMLERLNQGWQNLELLELGQLIDRV